MLLLGAAQHRVNESQEMARVAFRQLRRFPPQALQDLGVPLGAVPGDGTGMSPLRGWVPIALGCLRGQRLGGDISFAGDISCWGHLRTGDISALGMSPCWGHLVFWGHLLIGWGHLLVGDISLMAWGCPLAGCQPGACRRGWLPRARCGWQPAAGRPELARRGAPRVCHPEGLPPRGFVTLSLRPARLRAPRGVCLERDHRQPSPREVQDGAAWVPAIAHPS